MKPIDNDEMKLQEELLNAKSKNKSMGFKTQQLLDKKGIKSPPLIERIHIKKGLYISPKKPFKNDVERREWVKKQKDIHCKPIKI